MGERMKVYLDKDKIKKLIDIIVLKRGLLLRNLNMINDSLVFEFESNGKVGLITFYFNKKGYVSIVCSNKNKELEKLILEDVKNSDYIGGEVSEVPSINDVIDLSNDQIEETIAFLKLNLNSNLNSADNYRFTSKFGESIFVNKYNNKITIQGKAGYSYSQLIIFLHSKEYINIDKVNTLFNNLYMKGKDYSIISYEEKMKGLMPKSFVILNNTVKEIMLPSLILIEEAVDLPEYGAYVFPAYKGLEGFIKQLLNLKEINYSTTLGGCFNKGHNNKYELSAKSDFTENQIKAINNLYNFFVNKRNPLFHVEKQIDTTSLIYEREVAKSKIYDTINLIEESYKLFIEV